MRHARGWMNRVVAVMHLIDDGVFRPCKRGSHILCPAFRVGAAKVYHRTAPAVHTHRLGEDARRLFHIVHLEGVELPLQVAAHAACPCPVFAASHSHCLLRLAAQAFRIQTQPHAVCSRAPQREHRLLWRIHHLIQCALAHRIIVHRLIHGSLHAATR